MDFLKDKINQKIFSNELNIFDKPDILKGLGSRSFDSEGVKTNTLKLVEQGVLRHYLVDTYNGKKLNLKSNGRCGGTSNLYFDNAAIGGNQDGAISILTAGITTSIGDVVQITGISTVSDAYYRITSVPTANRISIAKTSGDPDILANHIVIPSGPSISVSSSTFLSGITTFTCSSGYFLSLLVFI